MNRILTGFALGAGLFVAGLATSAQAAEVTLARLDAAHHRNQRSSMSASRIRMLSRA